MDPPPLRHHRQRRRRHSSSATSHNFPPQVPSRLRRAYAGRGVQRLFPWQTQCLADPSLFAPDFANIVYSAPTSAGKTLIAEVLAAHNCLKTGRRALFVLPYISSAREKFLYLQSLWRSVNLTVKAFIGASSSSIHGWSAAVCTIEKANALLNALVEAGLAADIGIVVVDELHMVFDPDRGTVIENLLAKLLFISQQNGGASPIQLVGMSATLGGPESHRLLSQWLRARAFATEFRPIALRQFLLLAEKEGGGAGAQIVPLLKTNKNNEEEKKKTVEEQEANKENRWQSPAAGGGKSAESKQRQQQRQQPRQLEERFVIKGDNKCMIGITVEALIQAQLVLVFCATKAEAEQSAILLAKYVKYCVDKGEANRFPELNALFPRQRMQQAVDFFRQKTGCTEQDLVHCVGQGVAYHHAGLTVEEREEIESMYRSGHIRVLVSTSTLSSGVNLPAHRVLIRTNASSPVPLNFITYNQMVGRAGRQGQAQVTEGQSFLLCSHTDWPVVERQIGSHRHFGRQPTRSLGRLLLETINSSLCATVADVQQLIACCAFSQPARPLEEELAELAELKLIAVGPAVAMEDGGGGGEGGDQQAAADGHGRQQDTMDDESALRPTQLGRAVLASSLDLHTAIQVFDGLQNAMQSICLDTELHMLFLVTPINNLAINEHAIDWHFFHQQWAHLPADRRRVANRIGIAEEFFMQKLGGRSFARGHTRMNVHIRFLASLVLFELINEKPLQSVARHWKINRGLLQALQQQAATYAYMIVSFCDRLGWIHLRTLLDGFAERLQFGVRRDLTELVRIQGIDAIRARAFHQQDISSLVQLANYPAEKICLVLRKAVPFELNASSNTDRDGTVNSWLHGEPPMGEMRAAKALIERAQAAVQEQIRAFQILPSITPDASPSNNNNIIDLSLRFDSSCLSFLDDEAESAENDEANDGQQRRPPCLSPEMADELADLSTSVLEEAWLSEDESVSVLLESPAASRELLAPAAEEANGDIKKKKKKAIMLFDQTKYIDPEPASSAVKVAEEDVGDAEDDGPLEQQQHSRDVQRRDQQQQTDPTDSIETIGGQTTSRKENNTNAADGNETEADRRLQQIYQQSWLVVEKMAQTGMHMDRRKAEAMAEHILEQMAGEEAEIFALAGEHFNLDSAAEVSKILFVRMQLCVPEHIVSRHSRRRHLPTSSGVLKQIGHPICGRIERWRKLDNALSCLRALLAAVPNQNQAADEAGDGGGDGGCRVRTHFEQDGCTSGRILCHSPNLQFVPKRALMGKYSVRSMFTAPRGRVLVAADYCQLELRILGALSRDRRLATVLAKEDPFEWMAQLFAGEEEEEMTINIGREKAKRLCYAIIYGMGAENLGKELRMPGGADEARQLLNRFFQLFPRVKSWLDSVVERCKRTGQVRTHFGTRRQFQWEENVVEKENAGKEGQGKQQLQQQKGSVTAAERAMERRCVNFVIQGTASELFRQAMIKVDAQLEEHLPNAARLVMQLHDELIAEADARSAPKCAALLKRCMESVRLLDCGGERAGRAVAAQFPVKLSKGNDWGSLVDFKLEEEYDEEEIIDE